MEARVGGGSNGFYIADMSNGLGKNSLEWDQNDWRWDSELFMATPLNAAPSNCRSKQLFPASATGTGGLSNGSSACSDETDFRMNGKGKAEAEKRRRIIVEEEDGPYDEAGALTLKLGGHVFPIVEADLANWEGRNGVKQGKPQGGSLNRATCQVEGCGADLSDAKDYHRRHKVCEMHAKASRAMVGNVMQRFCQQCSRFHLLQEFDEGKRSCRRRLAGHNRRRRKTNPDASPNGLSLTDDQASSYLLITLLRILSNLHSDGSDQAKDQDLLPSLLRNIASLAGSSDASTLSRLLQASQDMRKHGTSDGTSSETANPLLSNGAAAQEFTRPFCSPSKMSSIAGTQGPSVRPIDNSVSVALARVEMPSERNAMEASLGGVVRAVPSQRSASLVPVEEVLSVRADAICSLQYGLQESSPVERARLKDFDLNNTYNDAQDCVACEQSAIPGTVGTGSPDCPSWILQDSHQSSPPQASGNSDSTSGQSLSNSNGDTQSRTERIVFKLFGKDPNDFPLSLRGQILDWLSHSPTDMESYIRPGCIILTIYLRLAESEWEDLSCDLSSSLSRLLHAPGVDFWRAGWICARIQHRIAFIYNGQVLLDSPLLLKGPDHCSILSITPIAVAISARVNFKVKGFNLVRSTVRLLCAFEGRYVIPETPEPLVEDKNTDEHDGSQCCSFYCSVPNSIGRGFIEVEDNGLSSGFFPFLVAEENVCSEIRMLESIIEVPSCDDIFGGESDANYTRNQAIDFLHEMGWLLRKSQLRSGSDQMNSHANLFPLNRFKWLMVFAMDRQWCAVVKKLLDILFEGIIELGGHSAVELALSEDLLHTAVRKNYKLMVELLLRYKPDKETDPDNFLFKPDMLSSASITPLHIAACKSGAEGVLEALTDDPGQLGIKAWNSARDITGFTPEDYARSRGFSSYLDLVQKKIAKKLDKGHVVLDIPGNLSAPGSALKQPDGTNPNKLPRFQIDESKLRSLQQPCCFCDQQLVQRGFGRRSLLYRPVMLSMVGIAAVCVCVGLLLKGPPEVIFVDNPFRWESLEYGWI